MAEPNWLLKVGCIGIGLAMLSFLHETGPLGPGSVVAVGSVAIGSDMAKIINRWWRRTRQPS